MVGIDTVLRAKPEELRSSFSEWPRLAPSYQECVSAILEVGLSAPDIAFEVLCGILPNPQRQGLYGTILNQLQIDVTHVVHKEFADYLIYFLFADTSVQLVSHTPRNFQNGILLTAGLDLVEKEYGGKSVDPKVKEVFEQLNVQALKQFSVLISLFGRDPSGYEPSLTCFKNAVSGASNNYLKLAKYCILFRYLRHPPDKIVDFFKTYVKELWENRVMLTHLPLIAELIKNLLLQMKECSHSNLQDFYTLFEKPEASVKKQVFEFKAILGARDSDTTPTKIFELFDGIPKDFDRQTVLRAFLYLLRGDHCEPDNEFWEWGEQNGGFETKNEIHQLMFPNQRQLLTDRYSFCSIFTSYIRDRMDGSSTASQIIFNLLSRNMLDSLGCLLEVYKDMPIDDTRAASFLHAFTLVFHPKTNFVEAETITAEQLLAVKATLRSLIEQKIKTYNPPDISHQAYFCRSVSVQACPRSISPDDDFRPAETLFAFTLRITQAEKRIVEQLQIDYTGPMMPTVHCTDRVSTRSQSSEKSALYLVSLLYQTMTPADATPTYFWPIVRMAVCRTTELAFFALYALQVFYINKPYTAQSILSTINKVFKSTAGGESAFTLLNLLYQLLSLPRIVIEEKDFPWLTKWSKNLQALLLAQLASPYVEVRDLTLLVMNRLDPLLSEYEIRSVASVLSIYKNEIATRATQVLALHGITLRSTCGVFFEDAARTRRALVYVPFLSEVVQAMMRSELKPILQHLWRMPFWTEISLPQNDDPSILSRILPVLAMANRFAPISRETSSIITNYGRLLSGSHSLSAFGIDSPIVYVEGEQDILSQRTTFYSNNIPILLTRALAGSSLAYQTVVTFATTSSLDLVGLFLTKVIDILTRPGNNTLQPVTQIIKIVKAVAESPDVRLITATQKTAMSLVFGKFFPLIHKILEQLGFHVNDGIVETPDDALQKLIPLLEAYCKCLQAFVQTFNAVRDPRAVGAVRGTPHAPFLLPEVWEMSDRRKAFDYLVSLIRSSVADSIGASAALKSVIQSVVLFDSNFQVTTGLYKLFCDMEAREEKVLKFLLLRHLDNLFLEFVSMSILRTAAEGHYFLRALAGQFCGENNEVDLTDLTPEDHQISNFLIGHIGSILILCFLLLSSPHKESRRVAFELLQRVSPIAAAYNDPFNVVPSARVNDYLKTHRNSLCALAFPPSPEELFELSTVFAKHMPFLTHRVFFEFLELFLNTDNFLQQNANLITALLNAVAPFARNTTFVGPIALPNDFDTPSSFTPFTLIRNLISRFSLLGKTSQLAWSRIFAEICHIEVNVVPLVQILVISGAEQANVDAVQTVCLYLVQSQAASVLQLLTQPLVFGSWFNTNVVEQSPHDWLKLSLRVLREVSQSNFTFLFPYLHVIFHFCLLFLNDDSHPNAVDVRILFDSVMSALLPQFRFPVKVRISFTTAEASTAIPIATLVSEIRERLEQVVPSAIHRWSQDALQWAVCCGNLTIASESALIYASVLNSPNYSDALPLIRAVDAVLKANDRNHRTEIFSYTRAALTALTSIVDVAVTQKTASLLLYVFDFAANFVNIVSVDLETARAAIRVLTVFITSQNLTEVERIAPRLLGIAKMLPNSFNDGSVLQFLTALIVHLPPATSQTLKVISLALLLPVFFAVVSAYHSVDPYSTFIEDNLVIQVFTAASEIGGAEFAGDSRYSEILINYFGNDETIRAQDPPDFLIKELAQEMWNSDSSELSLLGRFYAEMVKMDSNTVNSAIFTVVKIFILAVNDKPAICRIFADVICLAVRQIDRVAVELLGTFGKYAPPDIFTGPISTAPESTQIEEEVISVISRAVNEEIFGSRLPLLGQDSIVLQNRGCIIPMIPQFLPKSNELFVKVQFQPFFKQKEFWIALQSTLSNNLALQFKNPSAFDIYAHSQASSKTPEEQKVITSEIGCDAQLFILKDDELADFEKRLN